MTDYQKQTFIRIGIFVLLTIIIVAIIVGISTSLARQGKIPVTIEVLPTDAIVLIDGKKDAIGTTYLTAGSHTFVAKKEGFSDYTVTTTISNDTNYVGLLPEPASDAARAWQTSEIQAKREAIGGQMAQIKGQATIDQTKIIQQLPYTDIAGPFQIDYGVEPSRTNGVFLLISSSTPSGRLKAIQWMRDQGYNPVDLDIRYDEYINPLTSDV